MEEEFQFPEFLQALIDDVIWFWVQAVPTVEAKARWQSASKSTFCGPQNVVLCLCYLQLPWNRVRWCCFPWQFWSFFQPRGCEVCGVSWASRNMWVDTSAKDWSPFDTAFSCWKCMEVHVSLFNWMRWFSPSHAKRVLGPNEIKQLLLYWTCAEIMTN